MFNAKYFTYDNIQSSTYGLVIADFDDSSTAETLAFSPVLNTVKPPQSNRFYHGGISYQEPPTFQFSVISEDVINNTNRREILSWLVGRREFKRLVIHQIDLEEYYYNCVFTEAQIIYVNGDCHGFRLTATFDSPYGYGVPTQTSIASAGTYTKTITNLSDLPDNYVYPIVSFAGTGINIVNTTDDNSRAFTFAGLNASDVTTVDNEAKIITSTITTEPLGKFTSKKWLRLKPGINSLSITCQGAVTITCPNYVTIGF